MLKATQLLCLGLLLLCERLPLRVARGNVPFRGDDGKGRHDLAVIIQGNQQNVLVSVCGD